MTHPQDKGNEGLIKRADEILDKTRVAAEIRLGDWRYVMLDLRNALQESRIQSWQTMASAPRNGTWILLWSHEDEAPGSWKYSLGAWVNESNTAWHDGDFGPTHWMPLPSPPSTNELKESHEH